jgi:hypothetical protein
MMRYKKAELDNMVYEFRDIDLKTGKIVNTFYVKGEIYIPNNKLVHEMNRWFDVPDFLKTAGCDCVAQRIM